MKAINTQMKNINTFLAPGLKLRAPRQVDAKPVSQLIIDVCTADGDPTIAGTCEELKRRWKTLGSALKTNAWLVETGDRRIVGYEEFYNQNAHASFMGDGYVHPSYRALGIGTTMLQALEARARVEMCLAEVDLRVFIRNMVMTSDKAACQIHETEGYHPIHYSWHMKIDIDEVPEAPAWPVGIELRPFVLQQHNRAVFEAHSEAFRDNWGHTPKTFEDWQVRTSGSGHFDPSLWFIAWDGNQIAGYCLCHYRRKRGWIGTLGVRRAWRKQGIGTALLLYSFGEFYRRGTSTIELGVDAQNRTGATHLYKKIGMHVAAEYVIYEKELRPGHDPEE